VRVLCLGWPDKLIEHGSQSLLMAKYGLDGDGIHLRVSDFVAIRFRLGPVQLV
jgi:deoxyxylulose-5-phosphate synthase